MNNKEILKALDEAAALLEKVEGGIDGAEVDGYFSLVDLHNGVMKALRGIKEARDAAE